MTSPVQIDHLTVRYGRKTAVEDLTLTVPQGAVTALLGRNGAGKSSLIRCLLGQQRATAGRALLFGEDAWSKRARLMEKVGIVPEESDAPPEMRVAALSKFFGSFYPRWEQHAVDERLARFRIDPKSRFGDLSKGQKKHVHLALALASKPELLVLDDPTLGLDAVARKILFEEVIGDLADHGTTVLLTTHDLAEVETIADRVAILKEGHLVLDEELETLKQRFRRVRAPMKPVALEAAALHAAAVRAWGTGTEAVVTNYDDLALERFRGSGGGEVEVSPMSLEEIFVAVAGEEGSAS